MRISYFIIIPHWRITFPVRNSFSFYVILLKIHHRKNFRIYGNLICDSLHLNFSHFLSSDINFEQTTCRAIKIEYSAFTDAPNWRRILKIGGSQYKTNKSVNKSSKTGKKTLFRINLSTELLRGIRFMKGTDLFGFLTEILHHNSQSII